MRSALRCLVFLASLIAGQGAVVDFPTDNRALLTGQNEAFYMYVDRDFEGAKTKPWDGGAFGFVRGPIRTGREVVFATVHEGIDIQPMRRDAAGAPLDDVRAAANGVVVHVSSQAGASNYGRYAVVEHRWDGSPFYTLYAHLATLSVTAGQSVRQGDVLGKMGYTGAGIDRTRAHLHFEVAMLMSRNFQGWYDAFQGATPNMHGLFNGMNLVGTDPSAVLLAASKNQGFSLARHIASLEPFFKLTIPNTPGMSLIRDYPWLIPDGEDANPAAWTVAFTRTGVPVRMEASATRVSDAQVVWVKESSMAYSHATRGLIGGPAGQPRLTESGMRFAKLLIWPG